MSNLVIRRVEAFLQKEMLTYETDQPASSAKLWKASFKEEVFAVYAGLSGQLPDMVPSIAIPSYPILLGNCIIVGDDELAYNRYAAVCFRSAFYQKLGGLRVDACQRYCRQFENNCKKVGLRKDIWTNTESEKHFGQASDPGDFYGNGSPGWKMIAFENMLRDMVAVQQGYQLLHISIYDQVMSGGKLLTLGELMKSPSGEQYATVEKYLKRKLGLPIAAAE